MRASRVKIRRRQRRGASRRPLRIKWSIDLRAEQRERERERERERIGTERVSSSSSSSSSSNSREASKRGRAASEASKPKGEPPDMNSEFRSPGCFDDISLVPAQGSPPQPKTTWSKVLANVHG